MIDRNVLTQNKGGYELERSKNKLSIGAMFFVLIKSTIGLAIFGYHEVFIKSGWALGIIVSVVYIYAVVHGCMRLVTYAEEVESDSKYVGQRVDSYFGRLALLQS